MATAVRGLKAPNVLENKEGKCRVRIEKRMGREHRKSAQMTRREFEGFFFCGRNRLSVLNYFTPTCESVALQTALTRKVGPSISVKSTSLLSNSSPQRRPNL
eukprot:6456116-Amphidinium_carterae.3